MKSIAEIDRLLEQFKREALARYNAVMNTPCPYCKTRAGELCRTIKGNRPGTPSLTAHHQRVLTALHKKRAGK